MEVPFVHWRSAMFRSLVCCALLFLVPCAGMAVDDPGTAPLSPSEAHAVRSVVQAQLKALADKQDDAAFAYATPRIQGQYHDAVAFAEMVRTGYPMLIRPASISFFQARFEQGAVLLPVQFRDHEGRFWRAVYELRRQPDQSWRINGCSVAPDEEATSA
jgi:Domain of unknown function (DUF4864)